MPIVAKEEISERTRQYDDPREIGKYVVPAAAKLGVTIVRYSPLGCGMLTGQASASGSIRWRCPPALPPSLQTTA